VEDSVEKPDRPRNAALYGVLALIAAAVVGGGFYARVAGADPAESMSWDRQIETCIALQGDKQRRVEEAHDCMVGTMERALVSGLYPEFLQAVVGFRETNLYATCHAAGHAVGDKYGIDPGMEKTLDLMFKGQPAEVDYLCTTAVVHGLVRGAKESGETMADIANHCLSLDAVDINYTNECAHFYGHEVWWNIQEFGPREEQECLLLKEGASGRVPELCAAGVTMEKYDLQTKLYEPWNQEAVGHPIPSFEETSVLCDAFDPAEYFWKGCMGAVGWFAALRAQQVFTEEEEADPANFDRGAAIYAKEMAVCRQESHCLLYLLTHMRPTSYRNGFLLESCRVAEVDMDFCKRIVDRRNSG
jgi:hypothetical protein